MFKITTDKVLLVFLTTTLVFLSVCVLTFAQGSSDTEIKTIEPQIHSPDSIIPGEVLQVEITGEGLENVAISLLNQDDTAVSRSRGFVWKTPTGRSITVALLGIPSTLESGSYLLQAQAIQAGADWSFERAIEVLQKDYPEKIINLTGTMTTLLDDNSERKKTEAKVLWQVLGTFNPLDQFHYGRFSSPLPGGVPTSGFGNRRRYRRPDGSERLSVHFGTDLWSKPGTNVLAPGRGKVVLAVERFLTGNTVILEHLPGLFTSFYHLDSINVLPDQIVQQNDPIGTIGQTGFATGVHLHWEVRVNGVAVSPNSFLDKPLLDTSALMVKL